MSKRTFTPLKQADTLPLDQLPTDKPVAVYYRQSSLAQVGNVSTSIQTVDMVEEMHRRGWPEDKILLIDMDAGISGTTKIDERLGMSQLFDLITQGFIGAVACVDEDRLFRDVTQIQVNIFVEACRKNAVQVVTPSITYVFHHPMMGQFYIKQFRFKSEMAAEYLNYIRNRMLGARDRLRRQGLYAGGKIPLGYMADARKDSPTYRRLVPWPEVADVTRRVFEAFVECGGHTYTTSRILHERGIRFPDFSEVSPPEGFTYPWQGGTRSGFLTAPGIAGMMTNPAYIGHWIYNGAVLIWDNHEPIVSDPLFYAAFNFLSPNSLDGSDNPNFFRVAERIVPRPGRQTDRPLLGGLLWVQFEGKWRRIGAQWSHQSNYYSYTYSIHRGEGENSWSRRADQVDEAVIYHALERLRVHVTDERVAERAGRPREQEHTRLETLLSALAQQRVDLLNNIAYARNPAVVSELESRFEALEAEIARTRVLRDAALTRRVSMDRVGDAGRAEKILGAWPQMPRELRREIIVLMVKRIEIADWRGKNLRLHIFWHDDAETKVEIWQRHEHRGSKWSYAEQMTLIGLIEQQASREAVLAALPGRSWDAIRKIMDRFMPAAKLPRSEKISATWAARYAKIDGSPDTPSETDTRYSFKSTMLRPVIPFTIKFLR